MGRGKAGRGFGKKGGRGRGKGSSSGESKPRQKTLADYQFYIGSAKQASDYVNTAKFIINHIRMTYQHGDDVATALENKQEFDFTSLKPTLVVSTNTDTAMKAAQGQCVS